ncbi:hypothetical protein BGZ70_000010 [Mortierella alpina]|uniref:Uncharacterized protein n=1 Tax=Mortierella alpina TaxID=64518 RepID=A0A9P6JFC7_MORAP|nr:hypothetical protein BGZ70_000010 [Mortierella alpina]
MAKTILTLAFALAAVAVAVSAAGAVAEAAPVPALAQDDVFDYSQYETPPIWQEYKTFDEGFIPINQRPGGARGGDDRERRRRRTLQKRVVIHSDSDVTFNFGAQVDPLDASVRLNKRAEDLDEDEQYVEEDDEQDEQDAEDEIGADEDEDEEKDFDEDMDSSYDSQDQDDSQDQEDSLDQDDPEEDEEEERRLDNEAGLEDWIDEMRSEEFRHLAGHPEGRALDDDQYQQFQEEYIEDEPQPSEEELFAASWRN